MVSDNTKWLGLLVIVLLFISYSSTNNLSLNSLTKSPIILIGIALAVLFYYSTK